ncbi:MAG: universal stress protein [Dehalococcoidales bacterium]|nr:universal stress protein [Dehalococcoidales bacterium]
MYTRILVPLDGSKLAECVLPHVEAVASGCAAQEVILVSVTEKIRVKENLNLSGNLGLAGKSTADYQVLSQSAILSGQMVVSTADQPSDKTTWIRDVGKKYSQADKYLHRIQRGLTKKGLNIRISVLLGNPAEAIVSFAEQNEINLIIMASHGRSGISRWASGSVTERVFRRTCVPILMVRAPGCVPGF